MKGLEMLGTPPLDQPGDRVWAMSGGWGLLTVWGENGWVEVGTGRWAWRSGCGGIGGHVGQEPAAMENFHQSRP